MVKSILENSIHLTDAEWSEFLTLWEKHEISAKEILLKVGQTASKLFLIEKGLCRNYQIHKGKEITTYIASDFEIISNYASFISQTPSFEYLETLEKTSAYSISYDRFNSITKKRPSLEKLRTLLAEKNYLCVIARTQSFQTKTAKERYLEFLESSDKNIIQRTPQHIIATYIGIAAESLSRIRKEILIS